MIGRRAFLKSVSVAAAAGAAATPGVALAKGAALTAVDVHPSDYPTVEAVRWMGSEIERETAGRLSVRIYASGQLGTETDTVTLTRMGVLDICRVTAAALNNAFPLTRALTLPFSYRDDAHMRSVVDGPIGAGIRESFSKRGLVALCFYDGGLRSIYNVRRPIHGPGDLRGLKIRAPRSDIFIEALNAMGANATPLPFGEVFTGLQTHLIDGAENNWSTFQSTRQYEAAPFWSDTEHAFSPDALLISKAVLDSMTPADRDLLREKALQSVPFMRGLWDAKQAAARETVLAAGVRRNSVERAAFQRAVEPLLRRHAAEAELGALMRRIHEHA